MSALGKILTPAVRFIDSDYFPEGVEKTRELPERFEFKRAEERNTDDKKAADAASAPPEVVEMATKAAENSITENETKKLADAEKKKELYDKLKADFVEFQTIQKDILAGMKEIDPLLNRAETFISKFESFGKELKKK